jgi:hypothetical protein
MKIDSLDVVGQKAIIESTGSAMQKNGKPYNNKYAVVGFGRGRVEADVKPGTAGF